MIRYRTRPNYHWLVLVLSLVMAAFIMYRTFAGIGAQSVLERQYASVESVDLRFFQMSCFAAKHRLRYDYVARDAAGKMHSGYICYSLGNLVYPMVHENTE